MQNAIEEYNKIFWEIVGKYDISDSNIMRKVVHSFTVANTCFAISCKLKLNKHRREFCYLLGLFHDIGRFEQWKTFGTYNDKKSIDHGDLSANIIENSNADFGINQREKEVLSQAIKFHTKPYLGSDNEIIFYNKIINSADAYSNVLSCANGAHRLNNEECGLAKENLECFKNLGPLFSMPFKTRLERSFALTANLYYVRFDFLREEILNYGYFDLVKENFLQYLNDEEKKIYTDAVEIVRSKYLKDGEIIVSKNFKLN